MATAGLGGWGGDSLHHCAHCARQLQLEGGWSGGTFCAIGAAKGVLAHDFVHWTQPGGTRASIFVHLMTPEAQREQFFSVCCS